MIATENILDVRVIEPRLKHPSIFNAFDTLGAGEILTIINDHDPLPLYYQLKAERPNIFSWQYKEEGPEVWKVNIQKLRGVDTTTIGDMVRENPKSAAIFKKYKIDFCCQGKRLFQEACEIAGVSPAKLQAEIDAQVNQPSAHLRVQDWSMDLLVDYIVANHHSYVKKTGGDIKGLVDKVARVHGSRHPELLIIRQYFHELMQEMDSHMLREEEILFPAIKLLSQKKVSLLEFDFGSVANPISMMEMEHEDAGSLMEAIRIQSREFQPPQDACTSYRLLFSLLQEFEEDLFQHIHLENNVLFPKAKKAEEQITQ